MPISLVPRANAREQDGEGSEEGQQTREHPFVRNRLLDLFNMRSEAGDRQLRRGAPNRRRQGVQQARYRAARAEHDVHRTRDWRRQDRSKARHVLERPLPVGVVEHRLGRRA
jgi:hypothetical protein